MVGLSPGFLNVFKPVGVASRTIDNAVQRVLRSKGGVGHVGTLDPLAEGVLPVAVGAACKLIPYLPEGKKYQAVFKFGIESPTWDSMSELQVTGKFPRSPEERAKIAKVLEKNFVGKIDQQPPSSAAIRVNGVRGYDLVRKLGHEAADRAFSNKLRRVSVHSIRANQWSIPGAPIAHHEDQYSEFPDLHCTIECGPGTYVRSIGYELAEATGTSAIMTELRRTWSGGFSLENALTLPPREELEASFITQRLLPLDAPFLSTPLFLYSPSLHHSSLQEILQQCDSDSAPAEDSPSHIPPVPSIGASPSLLRYAQSLANSSKLEHTFHCAHTFLQFLRYWHTLDISFPCYDLTDARDALPTWKAARRMQHQQIAEQQAKRSQPATSDNPSVFDAELVSAPAAARLCVMVSESVLVEAAAIVLRALEGGSDGAKHGDLSSHSVKVGKNGTGSSEGLISSEKDHKVERYEESSTDNPNRIAGTIWRSFVSALQSMENTPLEDTGASVDHDDDIGPSKESVFKANTTLVEYCKENNSVLLFLGLCRPESKKPMLEQMPLFDPTNRNRVYNTAELKRVVSVLPPSLIPILKECC